MMYQPFKRICEYGESQGLTVFGAVKVQCPVCVLHLKMLTKDNDPFFPIERAILNYIDMSPNANLSYLSNLIGMDIDFVKCLEKGLRDDNMITADETGYHITENARRKYFSANGERPDVTVYGDVVVDGQSLELLDKEFYAARASYSDRKSEMIIPEAILGNDDPKLQRALKHLEKLPAKTKEEYFLERESHGYEIVSYEMKSIDNVYIVFSHDNETKKNRRDVFFKDRFIPDVDCLKEVKDFYYLSIRDGECHSSEGYVRKEGNPFFWLPFSEVKTFLQKRYYLDSVNDDDFYCDFKSTSANGYPLIVKVTEDMLRRSSEPVKILNDAMFGCFDVDVREGTYNGRKGGFFIVQVENNIPSKVERYKALKEYVRKNGKITMDFIKEHYPEGDDWRRKFVDLGLYEELEALDIEQFIQ